MSGTPTGTLTAKIIYDVDSAMAGMVQLGQITDKEGKRMVRQVAEINDIFKTLSRSQGAAAQAVQQTQQQMAAAGNSAKQTAWAMRTVPAQITDVFTQLAGGANPMMVLIQQGGQLKDVFGGFGPMFRGLATFITPFNVALTAGAAAVAALAFEMYEITKRQKEFDNALLLTGNFAAMSADRLSLMAEGIARVAGARKGLAEEAITAVAGTGAFGPQNIEAVSQATLRMTKITGESAATIAADFARMSDGVAKWAAERTQKMHFLTAAQYEEVRALEDVGRTADAVSVVMEAYNKHTKKLTDDSWSLAGALDYVRDAYSRIAEEQLKMVGLKERTIGDGLSAELENLNTLKKKLEEYKSDVATGGSIYAKLGITSASIPQLESAIKASEARVASIKGFMSLTTGVDNYIADIARKNTEGVNDRKWLDSLLEGKKLSENLNKELSEVERRFARMSENGVAFTEQERQQAIAVVRDKYKKLIDAPGPAKEGETFLKNLQRQVEQMQNGRFEMLRLEAAQKGVTGSAEQYIKKLEDADRRAKMIAQSVREANSRIDIEAKNKAAVDSLVDGSNEYISAIFREADAIGLNEEKLKALNDERAIEIALQKSLIGANAETAASLYAIAEQRKADVIAARAIQKAKEDAYKADPKNGERAALEAFVKDAADIAKFSQNLVEGSLKRAEDAFINFAKTCKLALGDLFGFMAEEYLRQMFRMQAADLAKSGGFSLSGMLGSALSWAGSLFTPHATGLDYVPYDGYPALLHEGEKVLTKNEARGERSSAQPINQTFYIGQGVTPAQVQMAMTKAREEGAKLAEGRILQSMRRQGAFSQ